jgi:hypothetical protein
LPSGQRARLPWSKEEEEALFQGVAACGVGAWKRIKNHGVPPGQHGPLKNRTGCDLKDKWRILSKRGQTSLRGNQKKRSEMISIELEEVGGKKKPRKGLDFNTVD